MRQLWLGSIEQTTRKAATNARTSRNRNLQPPRQPERRGRAAVLGVGLLAGLLLALLSGYAGARTTFAAGRHAQAGSASLADMQALFFVFASGTPAVQQMAARECVDLGLSPLQCAGISQATRAAWLDLANSDPAAVGRPDVAPELGAREQALATLTDSLGAVTGGRTAQLLAGTTKTYAEISQPQWAQANVTQSASSVGTVLVWATSYMQTSLPSGLKPKTSDYVALPDAYIKYANWGNLSSIPSIYQPYYAPNNAKTNWSVSVTNPANGHSASNVLVTDVGPWNEDDNWWDANGTSATLPASCPVAPTLVASDATSNPLVNGICPNGANLRRIYYYLLYTHNGLPFFQTSGYSPSGSFTDGNWPTALAQGCSEAAAASTNADLGVTCPTSNYNSNSGGWLRGGTYDSPVTNQSSIDLSPAMDKALGWTYPSSGLVRVTVSALP